MCRHCERLVEDVRHKQLVHDFMEVTAAGVNRSLRERKLNCVPVTANDIDIKIEVNVQKLPTISHKAQEAMAQGLFRMLDGLPGCDIGYPR